MNVLAGESLGAVLLFLGAQDVCGAAIAGQQVLAVLGVEQLSERLDPADDHEKIVLPRQREHRIDQIVARAFFAEVDFQAIGEEGEEADGERLLSWQLAFDEVRTLLCLDPLGQRPNLGV